MIRKGLNFGAKYGKPKEGTVFNDIDIPIQWDTIDYEKNFDPDIYTDLNNYPWPIQDNSYNFACIDNVIEHIYDHYKFLSELYRIMKPNGVILIIAPHWNAPTQYCTPSHKTPFDYRQLKSDEVKHMFKIIGLQPDKVRHGRLVPDKIAMFLSDHCSYIVGSVRVVFYVKKR